MYMYNRNMLTGRRTASISVSDASQRKLITDWRNFSPLHVLHDVQEYYAFCCSI